MYKIKSAITEFSYDQSFEEYILSHTSHIDLLEISLITNPSNATLEQELENTISKTISTTTSWSVTTINGVDIHAEAGFAFDFFSAKVDTGYHYSNEKFNGQEHTESQEVEYRINKKITVPPMTSVKVVSYVNWVSDLELPFTAKLEYGALGPVENDQNTLFSQKNVDLTAVKSLLEKAGYKGIGAKSVYEDPVKKTMVYTTDGVFKGSFGLNTVFSVEPVTATEADKIVKDLVATHGKDQLHHKVKILAKNN